MFSSLLFIFMEIHWSKYLTNVVSIFIIPMAWNVKFWIKFVRALCTQMDIVRQTNVDACLISKDFDALVLQTASAGFLFPSLRNKWGLFSRVKNVKINSSQYLRFHSHRRQTLSRIIIYTSCSRYWNERQTNI